MDNFIALGAFGSFCPPDADVTPDNDPNSPTYNGYKDVKAMTIQDAMKLVWLFDSADFSGSFSATASASNSGTITDNSVNPPVSTSYSSSVNNTFSYTWATSTDPNSGGKVTTASVEPQLRICGTGGNFSQSDTADSDSASYMDGTSANSRSNVSFHSESLGSGGSDPFIGCSISLPRIIDIRRFINNGVFIGYGFIGSIFSCNLAAGARAFNTFPFSPQGNKPAETIVNGFGSFRISCFTFENDIGQFAGLDSDAEVTVGGIPLYAQCIGSTTTSFSETNSRVRFSVNESDSNNGGSLNYTDSGGTDYNYSYSSSASITGNMDFKGITFYS
jgi:hypothetical protein